MTAIDTTGMTPEQARLALDLASALGGLDAAYRIVDIVRAQSGRAHDRLTEALAHKDRLHQQYLAASDALTTALGRPIPWVEER